MSTIPVEMVDNPIMRLTKDLKASAKMLSRDQARYLVDIYYQLQEARKAAGNQCKALEKAKESHDVLLWVRDNTLVLEEQIRRALSAYSDSEPIGRWAQSIIGIGPVISAGLMAHIDIEVARHAGQIWSFAGISGNPAKAWLKGQKRPFNAGLKVLCWKIGQSFLKQSNHDDDFYGKLLRRRWNEVEWEQNLRGALVGQADAKLQKFNIDKKTEAYLWYSGAFSPTLVRVFREKGIELSTGKIRNIPTSAEVRAIQQGMMTAGATRERYRTACEAAGFMTPKDVPTDTLPMLPPAHILQRACRWSTKLFICHWHDVAYELHFKTKPPEPWILDPHFGGHIDRIAAPNWPMDEK